MSIKLESYVDNKKKTVDFERKRFRFWLETVPADVRRLEHELWKSWRTLHHLGHYQFEKHLKIGRHNIIPLFTKDADKEIWEAFKQSFLTGQERIDRLKEILNQLRTDLPSILSTLPTEVRNKIRIIALTGSSTYGPRREGEYLSDTDINFLLNLGLKEMNFETLPRTEDNKHYHLTVTGRTDAARGSREQIHWLLYPHIPVVASISQTELTDIIKSLIEETRRRKSEIEKYILGLKEKINDLSQGVIY